MASTYEVTVVRARMPKSRAVLASIYVDGDVIGRTSRRRRVREPVWDRTFSLEVAEDKSLQTKVVFQEQVNNAASIVGTVELDGRELCAKTGEWRGWIKERKTISLISHRFAALIELRLAKPGEGPSPAPRSAPSRTTTAAATTRSSSTSRGRGRSRRSRNSRRRRRTARSTTAAR